MTLTVPTMTIATVAITEPIEPLLFTDHCMPIITHSAMNGSEMIDATIAALRAHGAELVGEVEQYENYYRLAYVRGPAGIIVSLAEQLGVTRYYDSHEELLGWAPDGVVVCSENSRHRALTERMTERVAQREDDHESPSLPLHDALHEELWSGVRAGLT